VKKSNPERFCLLEYDKLIIDQKIYVWNDVIGQVRHSLLSNGKYALYRRKIICIV
jgi:hypothetical protein